MEGVEEGLELVPGPVLESPLRQPDFTYSALVRSEKDMQGHD